MGVNFGQFCALLSMLMIAAFCCVALGESRQEEKLRRYLLTFAIVFFGSPPVIMLWVKGVFG